MAGCPSSHQPTRIREETLESGGPLQRKLNFRLRTNGGFQIESTEWFHSGKRFIHGKLQCFSFAKFNFNLVNFKYADDVFAVYHTTVWYLTWIDLVLEAI